MDHGDGDGDGEEEEWKAAKLFLAKGPSATLQFARDDVKAMLYALDAQAMDGPAPDQQEDQQQMSTTPIDPAMSRRQAAWRSLGDMSKSEAKKRFLLLLSSLPRSASVMVVVMDMGAHMGFAHPSFLSFCLTMALVLTLTLTSDGASAAILSKSNIEKCDKRSSKEMKCRQKIVIQLAVAAGKVAPPCFSIIHSIVHACITYHCSHVLYRNTIVSQSSVPSMSMELCDQSIDMER